MENHLLTVVKKRVMDIFTESFQGHPVYRDVNVYHKFHGIKERQQAGVILRSASASRIKMASDDFLGDLSSHCTLARVGSAPGTSLEWVWEDQEHVTTFQENEVATLNPAGSYIQTAKYPITAGHCNTEIADNFAQVVVKINGSPVMVKSVDGAKGKVHLYSAPPTGASVTISYYSNNLDIPGYYFLELLDANNFMCTPLHRVKDMVVIQTTTGIETDVNLPNNTIVLSSPYYLYTKKQANSHKLMLEPGIDYTLNALGHVDFLLPLRTGTTLYATYGWQGSDRGPFLIQGEDSYNDSAIRGVTLAFGSRKQAGDKHVVVLAPQRETMARVFGGHYNMQFELQVYARDPIALSEMVDHLVSDIWGNKRQVLMTEGLTIDDLDPSGESEEAYDDSAQIQYFQHSISLTIITEWKKFVPYMVYINSFNVNLNRFLGVDSHPIGDGSFPAQTYMVQPDDRPFEVSYPKTGYPKYF